MKPAPSANSLPAGEPRGDATCANIMQAGQSQAAIDSEPGWLAGYIVAHDADGAITADRLQLATLRTELLALCAEFPAETLAQAAERVLGKLQP